ncbi:MAG: PCYCGC motif-containing (lipo)protein [Acidimicrobiia bacterium]|nr:PCYCGC motif-containing (lipo)protein [Acidimicrobiia bacterium]
MPATRSISLIGALMIVASGLAVSACGESHDMDLADQSMLPEFARSAPSTVQEAYLFAVAHPDDLSHQPCYCGCGSMGHTSNLDCFIADIAVDGTITFDTHATGCGICVDIAQDTMRMTRDGKAPAEIRQYVDGRYGKFGPATPTPLPPA